MADVNDVAAAILDLAGKSMSTMKLQKLVYYSQAWHLVWDEEPLFAEPIEAWANGPVVRELYYQHRGRFSIATWPAGDPTKLNESELSTVEMVLKGYGHLNGAQLSALTHSERPWLTTRRGFGPTDRCSEAIDLDEMQDFYGALANDPEADAAEDLDWCEPF